MNRVINFLRSLNHSLSLNRFINFLIFMIRWNTHMPSPYNKNEFIKCSFISIQLKKIKTDIVALRQHLSHVN